MRAERLAALTALLAAACAGHTAPPSPAPIPIAERTMSLFLIGDAGKPDSAGDPVLAELARQAAEAPRGSAILFLGDNLYPRGLPAPDDPERAEMERRLLAQLAVTRKSGLKTVFVPGNHDWARMGADGWNAVRRSGEFIRERGMGLAVQEPGGGCPGPAVVDIGETFRLLLIDTEWWIRKPRYAKPRDAASGCPTYTEDAVTARLSQLLRESGGRQVIVAGHHPLATAGEHGGHFPVTTHLFPLRALRKWLWIPLPGLGSIYPLARADGISSEDLSGVANEKMRAALGRAFEGHPPLLYAAGHDHNLQVFRGPGARYSVVSGAGIAEHEGGVGWGRGAVFASDAAGFMRLDVGPGGRGSIRLSVTVVESGGAREAFGIWLVEP